MNDFDKVDTKYSAHLSRAGWLIFLAFDSTAKQLLKQAEKGGKMHLHGDPLDPTRHKLAESILDVLVKESQTDLIQGKVEALSAIIACIRKDGEAPSEYESRFTGKIAIYVNLTGALTATTSRQFPIVILRNEKLSNNTVNAVMYQLTSMKRESGAGFTVEIMLESEELKELSDPVDTDVQEKMVEFVEMIREAAWRTAEHSERGMFGVEDAASAVAQAVVAGPSYSRSTVALLGLWTEDTDRTARIRKWKDENGCKA